MYFLFLDFQFFLSSVLLFFLSRSIANCSGPGFALHSHIVMPYITNYGTPEQIEKFIPDMTAGSKIGAIAMTEPGAGRWVRERCK